MLREDLAATLREEHERDGYLFPAYDDYNFARVPATVKAVFGVDDLRRLPPDVFAGAPTRVRNVALVFVDGFGFEHWREEASEHEFFRRVTDAGTVTPLTSTCPSETAACVTSAHTGLFPTEHGLLGWDQYLAEIDRVVETLPFRTRDGDEPTGPDGATASADLLFEGPPMYDELAAEAGVESVVLAPDEQNETAYSRRTNEGAEPRSYDGEDLGSFGRALRDAVASGGERYVYGYLPHVDAAAHLAGRESDEYADALSAISDALVEEFLAGLDDRTARETLLLVVADHGGVDVPDDDKVDLFGVDGVADAVRRDREGDALVVGGPRNARLHLRDGTRDRVAAALREELDALVLPGEEAIERGLFGPGDPVGDLRERVGDLLVVPRERAVWHADDKMDLVGMHGGLHPREMLVPFAAVRASDARDR